MMVPPKFDIFAAIFTKYEWIVPRKEWEKMIDKGEQRVYFPFLNMDFLSIHLAVKNIPKADRD